ncbi:MarR family winged helix-turn-helix transcriptional regulator [Catenulispora rubra]|uniref:MarR family winged helix-turn-helix transcriptional regulator n=1 Tax=Catenulispora rubra TaxID=280293 RepID=UPI001892662D|nr:MarR family winged helix-turn-helix transcriptional regulator [Catenulispora rubra]
MSPRAASHSAKPHATTTRPGSDALGDVDRVTEAVLTASRLLVAVSARSLSETEDSLTLPQFRALVVLSTRGPLRLTHLAEHLAVNPSTAMRMAERLNAAGMIDRAPNPENRRESILSLTDAGCRVVEQVTERRRGEIAAIVERMPVEQRDSLIEALEAFSAAGGEPPAAHDPIPLGWQ